VILAVAVVVVAVLRRVGVPSIAGLILVGAIVGPNALGLIRDVREVELLAEIGVVLLLFGIGIDLSLDKLRALWRPVLVGGTLQVLLTIGVVLGVGRTLGFPNASSVFLGFVLAVSSTAIVLRALRARGDIDAPHGRLTLGILVFQDFCVVPMMLAVPLLAGAGGSLWAPLVRLLEALALLVVVFSAARLLAPRLLEAVARTRQRELFVLVVALICLGIAWGLSTAGISLALGAFVAGLVVADSGYRHQALSELIPFRELLTSLFFVSVGMLLDPRALAVNALPVALLLGAIVAGKFLLIAFAALLMRLPLRVSILTGASLAQVGEFSFILMRAADGTSLVPPTLADPLPIAVILSMLLTPLLLLAGPWLATGAGRLGAFSRLLDVRLAEECPDDGETLIGHVIIAGYGITGQELARALRETGVAYRFVDLNADNVRLASSRGEPAYFGDVTRPEVLESLGIDRARELVLCINDPNATEAAVRAARAVVPDLPILVRTRYVADIESLRGAGASAVVTAETEAAAKLTAVVLERHGVDADRIAPHVHRIRGIDAEP
jgi:CPA2 family monovalent cation:H+ antiporter-2